MKFRKKPIEIEAEQWFPGKMMNSKKQPFVSYDFGQEGPATIETLEGRMNVSKGDWIIRGVNGEYYPCKPDIFEKTYEKVSQEGDQIEIQVDGKTYVTIIDNLGVQRFKKDTVIGWLYENGKINLNDLALAYCEGKLDKIEYAEFNMKIGYSVDGWASINYFEDMVIKNPLWDTHE